ncbi:MAG: hypothetical protein NZ529_03910 [Cytophagaceae bacterium]|nr:hypothetical protein [Cytophagaceae bacterium]MDW8455917.1 hypothetical protein [Cytophagaceae bacterium]
MITSVSKTFLVVIIWVCSSIDVSIVKCVDDVSTYIEVIKNSSEFKNWLVSENYKIEEVTFSKNSETNEKIIITFFHVNKPLVVIYYTISKPDKKILNISVEDMR